MTHIPINLHQLWINKLSYQLLQKQTDFNGRKNPITIPCFAIFGRQGNKCMVV